MILFGRQIGELTVGELKRAKSGHYYRVCTCSCGNVKEIREVHLRDGRSKSCGLCNHKEKHPFAHKSWDSMKQRCLNPNAPDYPRYGGRGIKIDPAWIVSFMNFYRDMGDPPIDPVTLKRYSLDRIDNDGPYTKENCRWSDVYTQANNRSNSLHPAIAWARKMQSK